MKTILFFMLILLLKFSISSTIINIPEDQTTIQQGIENSVNGDTVLVQPGIYVENINYYGKNITVGSLFITTLDTIFISQTIIDGDQNGSVVTFENGENSTAILSGFMIINGYAEHGGGIYSINSEPTLNYLSITNNEATEFYGGGGISCRNSDLYMRNITISNNTTNRSGGGINFNNSDSILDCVTISDNTASIGGGILCRDNSDPTLENVTISNNHAGSSGGGIFCYNYAELSLVDVVISGNSANFGGGIGCQAGAYITLENGIISANTGSGISCQNDSELFLTNVVITGNYSAGSGGGIKYHNSNFTLENVTISNNMAIENGGGIFCQNESELILTNVTITGNSAEYGGGIYCGDNSNLIFDSYERSSIYQNNIFDNRGSGVDIFLSECNTIDVILDTFTVISPTDYYASPIDDFTFDILNGIQDIMLDSDIYVSVNGDNSNSGTTPDEPLRTIRHALSVILADSVNQNTIHLLPGIYSSNTNGEEFPLDWSSYVSLEGISEEETILDGDSLSGIFEFYYVTDATIKNITIRNGSAFFGGGIYCHNSDPNLESITLSSNYAEYGGGGLYCDESSSPNLLHVTISNNFAGSAGGGLYCRISSNPSLDNVTLAGNNAVYQGGGILCHESDPIFENIIISDNSANNGGGIFLIHSNPVLENVSISNNFAEYGHGGGIRCSNSSNPNMVNVSLTDNFAQINGGGIYCSDSSSPSITNSDIVNNSSSDDGGGIHCEEDSNPILENVTFSGNFTEENGGAISINDSNPTLENVTITDNDSANNGGGISCCNNSNPILRNVTVSDNSSNLGGGIYCNNSTITFDNVDRSSIYLNNILNYRGFGADLFVEDCNTIEVIIDTFTTLTPTEYYAAPITNYTFNILNDIQDDLLNSDIYVSVDGDNSNLGTNPDEPLRTIKYALSVIYADSVNPQTIFLAPGIYSPGTNGEEYPLNWSSYVSLEGDSEEETILDGDSLSGIFEFYYVTEATIKDITIRNGLAEYGGAICCYNSSPTMENVTITDNYAENRGGGIYCSDFSNPYLINVLISNNYTYLSGGGLFCDNSNPVLENVIITNNTVSIKGGGIYCNNSNPSLNNVIISNNSANWESGGGIYCAYSNPILKNVSIVTNSTVKGGGITCFESDPIFVNVTISGNFVYEYGGGIYCMNHSNPILVNCIFWNNTPEEVFFSEEYYSNTITITYSDIEDGESAIVTNDNGNVNWLEGNIDSNPLFINAETGDYNLLENSPCIDSGIAHFEWNNEVLIDMNEDDYYGTTPDMGTYEWYGVDTNNHELQITNYELINYPNPFNSSTKISFDLLCKDSKNAKIDIYNLKGQKVRQFSIDDSRSSIVWNG
ncbi:MAG: right-handed parallel beta-helix repeat-containing protein, partial [Candidatus Cloacimonetes bacterium]|nr:right-handed parallel beta-helix repeat-containing protein [Candidatus Cloacimonadota bacterium]